VILPLEWIGLIRHQSSFLNLTSFFGAETEPPGGPVSSDITVDGQDDQQRSSSSNCNGWSSPQRSYRSVSPVSDTATDDVEPVIGVSNETDNGKTINLLNLFPPVDDRAGGSPVFYRRQRSANESNTQMVGIDAGGGDAIFWQQPVVTKQKFYGHVLNEDSLNITNRHQDHDD